MAAEFETTMSHLLTDLKSTLMAYARSNATVQAGRPLVTVDQRGSWLRGFLSPATALPAVALLPVAERRLGAQSGNRIRMEREIRVEGYTKGLNADEVTQQLMDLLHDVRTALRDNPWVRASDPTRRKTVYSYSMGEIAYPEAGRLYGGVVASAAFSMLLRSYEVPTLGRLLPTTYKSTTDDVDFVEAVVNLLRSEAQSAAVQGLENIEAVENFVEASKLKLPALAVYLKRQDRGALGTGRITFVRELDVWVFTKFIAKETALDQLFDYVELVKSALRRNVTLNGLATESEEGTIQYGTVTDASERLVFGVNIPFTVKSYGQMNRGDLA